MSDLHQRFLDLSRKSLCVIFAFFLASCQFQPLHGSNTNSVTSGGLASVGVSQVDSRVAQQVRNHLLFLLNGGGPAVEKTHEARIRVTWNNKLLASIPTVRDSSAGTVTVTVSYDLVENATGDIVKSGQRQAIASYDRTGQVFANNRAERDAENRAAREAAEAIRLAIASDLNNAGS
ncbi:MAG: LPS assembly lipoprotein LptE [Rhizobiaceae bacterium]|nr:LPS assembly lipoprotein LptE [Rhizobiaceae bacterium]